MNTSLTVRKQSSHVTAPPRLPGGVRADGIKTPTITLLDISKIEPTRDTQARANVSQDVVADYAEMMENGDTFPPVIVFYDGATFFLADGFHRVFAATRIDRKQIEADVREGGKTDALWFALGANRANGQRMSRVDVRNAISIALTEFESKTDRAIARHIGCSHHTVSDERLQLESGGQIAQVPTRTGADGKRYPAPSAPYTRLWDSEEEVVPDPDAEQRFTTPDPLSGKVYAPAINVDEDMNYEPPTLAGLKRYWRAASKKNRKAFIAWIQSRQADGAQ